MRKGYRPNFLFNKMGGLVGIALGSDATTEHEVGIASIMRELTRESPDPIILVDLKAGKPVQYPDLLEVRRVKHRANTLLFSMKEADVSEACLSFGTSQPESYFQTELRFELVGGSTDLACAWDERSFAIRARGHANVGRLTELWGALQNGELIFGGALANMFLNATGIVFLRKTSFDDELEAAAIKAQKKYESRLRLGAKSESKNIMQSMYAQGLGGFIWPIWADEAETAVVYGFNPDSRAKATYYGPYTKEQLLEWAAAKGSYHLKPHAETM